MLIVIFIILVIVIVAMVKKTRSVHIANPAPPAIPVADIRRVFDMMQHQARDKSFAGFMFGSPDRPSADDTLNVQFSVEGTCIGFDWILLTQRNIEDCNRFRQFAESLGHKVIHKEENAVPYLRVEDGDLPALCIGVMQMYGVRSKDEVELVTDGFDWKQ